MLNIALIRNPIQPDKREDHSTDFVAGQSLQEYIEPLLADWPDTEFVVSVNGNVIENDDVSLFYPAVGDYVILMPVIGKGFGDILKSVLMIALVAWAGPAGMAMAGTTSATVMSGIYTGLIVGVGGAILNAIIPASQDTASVNYDPVEVGMSTSYGWNGSGVTEVPGTPVGRIYGTVSPTLVRLQRHVSTDGSNQYLNYLFSLGMGPVDSIQDMEIAGNPIANYEDVEYWTRLGTNDQATIANFNTNYDDYPLSYELENDSAWRTQRTEGNAVEGLEVMLQMPGGLYYTNDDASLGSASVTIESQYKLASSGTWIDMIPSTTITDANNAAIFKTFRVDNITSGQYDVRMRCTAKSGTTTRYSTRVYWVQLSEINYADFCYPNLVLWGVRIKATSQLSGSDPEFKCTVTRSKVWVWNPYTLAYEQKRATNPYWAGYDFLHHCEYLKNIQTGLSEFYIEGVAARRFDYDQYKRCADYADGLLPSGKYRFELNLFVEGSITVKDALNQIAMVGRGVFIPRGTKFSCICDMPMEMTTVFGDGRIITGSMAGEWQGVENRSRSVEVTFWNKENKYKKDMAPYQSPSYNEDGMIPNPTQLTYKGITDYEHAYLEAAFNGRCNEYKERTKSWQSDIDAIGCMIGDVVGVQSSTSKWGVGGRIVSATSDSVTLDQTVTLIAGQTYKVYLTLADDTIVQKTVVAVEEDTETNQLTFTEAFSTIPEKFDLYAFVTSLSLMRILSIVRANDLKAKITAEQYFAEIYDEDITIPERSYADFTIKTLSLSIVETLPRPADGTAKISVSWIWPRDSRNAKAIIYAGKTAGEFARIADVGLGDLIGTIITLNANATWLIKVDIVDSFGGLIASGQSSITIDNSAYVPESLDYLSASISGDQVLLTCARSGGINADGVEYRRGDTWESGQVAAQITGGAKDSAAVPAMIGTVRYWACPYNGFGYALTPVSDTISIDTLPQKYAVIDQVNFEEAASISGAGQRVEGVIYQDSTLSYDVLKDMVYSDLAPMTFFQLLGLGAGTVVFTGAPIDIGKVASVQIAVEERWYVVPDQPTIYEIKTSTDGITYSDWKLLPTGQINTRYILLRGSVNGQSLPGALRTCNVHITAPMQTYSYRDVVIPIDGYKFTFPQPFVNTPAFIVSPNEADLTAEKISVTRFDASLKLLQSGSYVDGKTTDAIFSGF